MVSLACEAFPRNPAPSDIPHLRHFLTPSTLVVSTCVRRERPRSTADAMGRIPGLRGQPLDLMEVKLPTRKGIWFRSPSGAEGGWPTPRAQKERLVEGCSESSMLATAAAVPGLRRKPVRCVVFDGPVLRRADHEMEAV